MALFRAILLCVAAIGPGAETARADWQFTRWGMSEAELTTKSPNIVPTTSDERSGRSNPYVGTALYKSGYRALEVDFVAYYLFQDGKLSSVHLVPADASQWPKLNIALEQVYGKPIDDKSHQSSGGTMFCTFIDKKWRAESEKNTVSAVGVSCNNNRKDVYSISYSPILSSSKTGL